MVNSQQQAKDNIRKITPQGGPPNKLRPPNLYYDHSNARQTFYTPARLQTTNGYIPIQGRQGGPQNFDNRRQAPPTDPGSSNSQDVRFMNAVVDLHWDDTLPLQVKLEKSKVNGLHTPIPSPMS